MKDTILFAIMVLIFVRSAQANNNSEKGNYKLGERPDDEPCTCVFNNNRMWNPEKILWNGEEWHCSKYNEDGTCDSVGLVNPNKTETDPCSKEATPLYCVFNLENAPKSIKIDDDIWKCSKYDSNQKCTKATRASI